jgi:hypothetical protein
MLRSMPQLTLISLYGDKPEKLAALIAECQDLAAKAIGSAFTRYDLRQVHATIIGMERCEGTVAGNANFSKYRGREVAMDFAGFLAHLRRSAQIPFEVQIGGFANRDYPFTSRNARPFLRSFSVQGDKLVVLGWPVRGEPREYPLALDQLRRAAQDFEILHSYHRETNDIDNDFFFRIGMIDPKAVTMEKKSALENQIREFLSNQPPLPVPIRLEDIFVAAYESDQLPLSSTRTWSLANPKVTGEFVEALYEGDA